MRGQINYLLEDEHLLVVFIFSLYYLAMQFVNELQVPVRNLNMLGFAFINTCVNDQGYRTEFY